MEQESSLEAEKECLRAEAELAAGNSLAALASFEKAFAMKEDPNRYSSLGYCIAKERGQRKKGLDLCQASLMLEPNNALHFLNLGKIHLLSGNKEEALRVFRSGILKEGSKDIIQKLIDLGVRKHPLFSALERSHPLNKYLGLLLSKLGLR